MRNTFVERKIKNNPFYTVTDASQASPNNPNDPKTPSNVKSTPSKSDLIELLKTKMMGIVLQAKLLI